MDPEQSDLGLHCLPVCKNWFEKFARIFCRRHKQTAFSDAGFLGALRVKVSEYLEKILVLQLQLEQVDVASSHIPAPAPSHISVHIKIQIAVLQSSFIGLLPMTVSSF